MMRIIIITPTRKSRTVKTQTMAAAQMSAAEGPATATKAPHPSAIAIAAASAAHCSGVSARIEETWSRIAAIALASRRARETRGGAGGNRGEERIDEALLRQVGRGNVGRKARDPHEEPVGHLAAQARGELHAQALQAPSHH